MPQVILKYYPYIQTARKFFAPFSFFPPYLPKKHRKSKFCVGDMRFCGGEGIGTWWGGEGIQKMVGKGIPPIPPLGRTLSRVHSQGFIVLIYAQLLHNYGKFALN